MNPTNTTPSITVPEALWTTERLARGVYAEDPLMFRAAVAGDMPAEALDSQRDRAQLIKLFHRWGWSDRQIERHTRWTLYTVARLRERLWLEPHPHETETLERTA